MKTLSDFKKLFRRHVTVVAGGPTNKTRGTDKLTDMKEATPNNTPSLVKQFRFFSEADRNADPDKGNCFEKDLEWDTCCTLTTCIIEKYREAPTQDFRTVKLVCIYDSRQKPEGYAYVDGSFTGRPNPARFVLADSIEARVANIPLLDPTKTDNKANAIVQHTIEGKVFLYKARVDGGPYAAPTDPEGQGTVDWVSVALPPLGDTYTRAEIDAKDATKQPALLVYENLSAYNEGATYDLPAEKLNRAIKVAILVDKRLNLPVLTMDMVPAILLLALDVDCTHPLEVWGFLARNVNSGGTATLIDTLQPGDRMVLLAGKTQAFYPAPPNTYLAGWVLESVTRQWEGDNNNTGPAPLLYGATGPATDGAMTQQATTQALATTLSSANTYTDQQLVSIYRPAGNWDASGGTFPTAGTGTNGGIRRGDTYNVTVAGTLGGIARDVGDTFYANTPTPGQVAANWSRFEANTEQATPSGRGTVKIASTTDVDNATNTNNTDAITPSLLWRGMAKLLSAVNNWTGTNTFSGILNLFGTPITATFDPNIDPSGSLAQAVLSGMPANGIFDLGTSPASSIVGQHFANGAYTYEAWRGTDGNPQWRRALSS
jgi:hypothetical protein